MTPEARFEFVPPGEWRALVVRRIGRKVAVAMLFQRLHWMVGVEVCGRVATIAVGPLMIAVGLIRPASQASEAGQ